MRIHYIQSFFDSFLPENLDMNAIQILAYSQGKTFSNFTKRHGGPFS